MKIGIALLIALAVPATALAQSKVAYVDLERAMQESTAGKKAMGKLKAEFDQMKGQLDKENQSLMREKEELEKKQGVMKAAELEDAMDSFRRKLRDFEHKVNTSQEELSKKEQSLKARIYREVLQVIREYGSDKGYTMIYEKGSLLYVENDLDLTDTIISEYDKSK